VTQFAWFYLAPGRQLPAGCGDIITARLARGGNNVRLHQHITKTLNGVRLGTPIIAPVEMG